jgi:hypothetical protein
MKEFKNCWQYLSRTFHNEWGKSVSKEKGITVEREGFKGSGTSCVGEGTVLQLLPGVIMKRETKTEGGATIGTDIK